jgi:transcriptional regulator with XRE-family HTH domain
VIARRSELGLTEQQLANRMSTSHSAVSRIESGHYPSKPDTLRRLAHALELRFVMGFESGPANKPKRQLVAPGRRQGMGLLCHRLGWGTRIICRGTPRRLGCARGGAPGGGRATRAPS